jgi:hypothetical protein
MSPSVVDAMSQQQPPPGEREHQPERHERPDHQLDEVKATAAVHLDHDGGLTGGQSDYRSDEVVRRHRHRLAAGGKQRLTGGKRHLAAALRRW